MNWFLEAIPRGNSLKKNLVQLWKSHKEIKKIIRESHKSQKVTYKKSLKKVIKNSKSHKKSKISYIFLRSDLALEICHTETPKWNFISWSKGPKWNFISGSWWYSSFRPKMKFHVNCLLVGCKIYRVYSRKKKLHHQKYKYQRNQEFFISHVIFSSINKGLDAI